MSRYGEADLLQRLIEEPGRDAAELEVWGEDGGGRTGVEGCGVALGLLELGNPALIRQLLCQPGQRFRFSSLQKAY